MLLDREAFWNKAVTRYRGFAHDLLPRISECIRRVVSCHLVLINS